jgi:hypothetical protein
MRTVLYIMIGCLVGCGPAEAPEELDQLTGFLFVHAQDEDLKQLDAGFVNLRKWMNNHLAETKEGFTVNNLSQKEANELDACERNITGLIGAAVATESAFGVVPVVGVTVAGPTMEVFPGFLTYQRENILNDADCFMDQSCELLHYDTYSVKQFPLGIEASVNNRTQHRWIETDQGTAHISRSWLMQPLRATPNWLQVRQQFYLSAMIPWKEGKSIRLQALWAITELGDAPVPESTALNIAIDEMKSDAAIIENWLYSH